MMNTASLLIVVHPGSLCGSLWTCGIADPAGITKRILDEIEGWDGACVAVYGDLEDELDAYEDVGDVINGIFDIVEGDPTGPGLAKAVRAILKLHPAATLDRVLVTGAWADPQDGCVTCVAEELRKRVSSLKVDVSPNAPIYPGA